MSVLDLPVSALKGQRERVVKALEGETQFGVGATFQKRREHPVMDEEWSITPMIEHLKEKAWAQLGTSMAVWLGLVALIGLWRLRKTELK